MIFLTSPEIWKSILCGFPSPKLFSYSSLLKKLATQEKKSKCSGEFLSYNTINHVLPDLLY